MTTESMPEDDVRMDMGTLLGAILSRWLRIIVVTADPRRRSPTRS